MRLSRFVVTAICSIVALSSVFFFYRPVRVHADVGEFSGAIDYFTSLPSAEVQALSPAGFAVAGAVFAVNQALSHPIEGVGALDASSLSTFSGMYMVIDSYGVSEYRLGTASIYSGSFNLSDGEGMAFLYGADYDCVCRFYGSASNVSASFSENGTGSGMWIMGFRQLGTGSYEVYNYKNNEIAQSPSSYFPGFHFNVYTRSNVTCRYRTVQQIVNGAYNDSSRPDLLGQCTQVSLPAGTIDADYPQILVNWVNENYPEYTYLFPDVPPEPIYPTDFVTGIPKDWTIENPPLPTSPNVSLSPRDADFSVIDPSEAVAQNASAFDFWWWLTDRILTYTDMKNIVVLFVGLGAVSYILWRIGR